MLNTRKNRFDILLLKGTKIFPVIHVAHCATTKLRPLGHITHIFWSILSPFKADTISFPRRQDLKINIIYCHQDVLITIFILFFSIDFTNNVSNKLLPPKYIFIYEISIWISNGDILQMIYHLERNQRIKQNNWNSAIDTLLGY